VSGAGTLDTFRGYVRPDGRVGVRNHVLILPMAPAANRAATLAREAVPGTVGVEVHQDIGPEVPGYALAVRTLAGWVDHPNVFATVLVAVSPRQPVLQDVLDRLAPHVRWRVVTLEEAGGTRGAAEIAAQQAREWLGRASTMSRQLVPVAQLLLATECGGSDACSGLSANPALGFASDLLIARGGTSILAETTELIGAERLLEARAVRPEVGARLVATVLHAERESMRMGVDFRGSQPAPGNIEGGITTIEEKSLGCVHKGGTSPLTDVIEYAERPRTTGLVVMDTPGHDVMQLVGMAAGGAQVVVFTTGRGTPTGLAICPVIKVSTRTPLREALPDLIDLDAGPIIDGHLTVEQVGWQLYRKILAVANGETVAAERTHHREFGIFQGWEGFGA
jgi:altronate dehydratase large subunit